MRKRIIHVHADDFGMGNEITDNIFTCIEKEIVTSVSIVCTTDHFEYGIRKYLQTSNDVRLCLHLNLVEGKPLTPKSSIHLLVNESGEFKSSFLSLWLRYMMSSKYKKAKYKEQVTIEIENQIIKYQNSLTNNDSLNIDSHMHFHMIPFVFDSILEVSKKYKIDFVRNPYELRYKYGFVRIKNYLALNFVKNILLNNLSRSYIKKAKKIKVSTNEFFVGVLSTGRMTYKDVHSALEKIRRKKTPDSVDILFHPGGVSDISKVNWTKKKAFRLYYSSQDRKREAKVLCEDRFKNLIHKYEDFFNN
ncbi:ChbG/HpnK family deacetylase [Aquimarina sp. 2201CG1-2-11]|uniref:carbohydrate deacetylase n=1 Tax=Aquimarina discodermiae TaxID=3231043 RepID=UPI0034622F8C